jgi:hypothetical protein
LGRGRQRDESGDQEQRRLPAPASAQGWALPGPTASSPWRKSDRAVRSGFGPDARTREAPNTRRIQASEDAADGPESARTATRRLSPRAARDTSKVDSALLALFQEAVKKAGIPLKDLRSGQSKRKPYGALVR